VTAPRERYDALLFDLDGTLFRGGTALPGAPEALAEAAELGCRIGYLTNNGSRNAGQVVEHLRALGFANRAHSPDAHGDSVAARCVRL